MKELPYLKVILDSQANIVDLRCDLDFESFDAEEVIGKNWFDLFIETEDRDKVRKVFEGLFNGEETQWQSFKNDIKCRFGHYKLMDFHNQIFERDGVKYINSVGIEHYMNDDDQLSMLADRLAE